MHARACRVSASLLVLAATVFGPTTAAYASGDQTASPALLQSNWYWHRVVADAPLAGVPDPGEPSNVPAGDLPVASRDGKGTPSKIPLIAFDLPALSPGSTVSGFTVTLTMDPNAQNLVPGTPFLVAALALRNWPNDVGGKQDTVNAPPVESTGLIAGKLSADGKSITFAIPAFAQSWVDDANFGLEVLPAKGYNDPFQISFLGGKDVKAAMTYSEGLAQPTAPLTGSTGTTPSGGNSGTAPLSTGTQPFSGGSVDSGTGFAPAPNVAVGTAPASAPGLAPQAAAPQTPAATSVRALREVSSRPAAGLIWTGAVLLGMLVLFSVILGGEPQAAAAAQRSRLSNVLRSRAAATPTERPAARRAVRTRSAPA